MMRIKMSYGMEEYYASERFILGGDLLVFVLHVKLGRRYTGYHENYLNTCQFHP